MENITRSASKRKEVTGITSFSEKENVVTQSDGLDCNGNSNSKKNNGNGRKQLPTIEAQEINANLRTPKTVKKRIYIRSSSNSDDEQSLTPPKRDKSNSPTSSSTNKTSPKTPVDLLDNLKLSTPTNRSGSKHISNTKCLSPKNLFPPELSYQYVRRALHSTTPTEMPGREEELQKLHVYLQEHLENKKSGALYISGPPGTGKTACVSRTINLQQFKNGFKTVYLNCTSMKASGSVYSKIAEELNLKVNGKNEKDYISSIERHLESSKKMTLLVLDEIDQLDSRKQAVLYTVFDWPSKPQARLVLIGIANALDLIDRTLPRLQATLEMKPQLMHFLPYTKPQIVRIFTERLKESGASEIFSPVVLQLLAGKVAAVSGDIRRALDIGRRVVELAEARKNSQVLPLQPTTDRTSNISSPIKSPVKNSNSLTVDLKEVMSIVNNVYGTSQTFDEENYGSFPLQQKVLICTLLLILKKGCSKDVTVGKLHEVYRRVCAKRKLVAVNQTEFLSLCQLVETRGIIQLHGRKEPRLSKVCLQWDEEEVNSALQDKQLLAGILDDASSLTK